MARYFFPTETFEAVINGRLNRYRQGERYTARDGPEYAELRGLVDQWAREGKVEATGEVASSRPAVRITIGGG